MTTRRQAEGKPAATVPRPRGLQFKFGREVISELRKVVWPTRQEATRLTIMVVIVSAAVGLALGVIDIGFSQLVRAVFVNG